MCRSGREARAGHGGQQARTVKGHVVLREVGDEPVDGDLDIAEVGKALCTQREHPPQCALQTGHDAVAEHEHRSDDVTTVQQVLERQALVAADLFAQDRRGRLEQENGRVAAARAHAPQARRDDVDLADLQAEPTHLHHRTLVNEEGGAVGVGEKDFDIAHQRTVTRAAPHGKATQIAVRHCVPVQGCGPFPCTRRCLLGHHPASPDTLIPALVSAVLADHRLAVVVIAGKGRGIIARAAFAVGDVVEVCPVIVVDDGSALDHTVLAHYVYDWKPDASAVAVALGCGSLYNHSYRPNARYEKRYDGEGANTICYRAHRPIAVGDEICVNYNGDPDDQSPLWFDVVTDGAAVS